MRYGAKVQQSYQLGVKKAVAYGTFTGGIGALAYLAMITCVTSRVGVVGFRDCVVWCAA